jgi:hypothetical protein
MDLCCAILQTAQRRHIDYLRTQGHDHVLSLLASSMADRGMIKPREPTSPTTPPMDERRS